MSETDRPIQVGDPLPRLASVTHHNGFEFAISWSGGSTRDRGEVVDLAPVILSFKVFRPLRDDADLLKKAEIVDNGRAIRWRDDDALEIAAATVERLADEFMTPADFRKWMDQHSFSFDRAAAELGISRRVVAYYAKNRNVPRPIALATKYISQQLSKGSDSHHAAHLGP